MKMDAAGNDFVMIDNRSGDVCLNPEQIVRICDRHHGVGADGILLLEKATDVPIFGCGITIATVAKLRCAATVRAALLIRAQNCRRSEETFV